MKHFSYKIYWEHQNTHFMFCNFFFRKSCSLLDNVGKKNCRAGQATDDDIIRRMRIACWITKDTATHSECVILLPLQGNIGYANTPQCYDILRTLQSHGFSILHPLTTLQLDGVYLTNIQCCSIHR